MEGNFFVNEAFSNAVNKYLEFVDKPDSEEFNSFLVQVIVTLVSIYGELDIMNPFRTKNEKGLDSNLKKFGLTEDVLKELKEQMLLFYQNEGKDLSVCRKAFISIQKILVDMFIYRKKHIFVGDDEVEQFKNFLYTRKTTDSFKLELYNKYTPNSDVILHYVNSKLFQLKHSYVFTEFNDILLSQEAYQIVGYNIVEVMHMKEEEIRSINSKVYQFFRIKESDLNKRVHLEHAVSYYKKYGNAITSGNGYVDMLLLLGFIATGLMFIIITGINFMG